MSFYVLLVNCLAVLKNEMKDVDRDLVRKCNSSHFNDGKLYIY